MELLNRIQKELKVPKGQFNAFAKYNYRNCEDILEAVKPLLGEGTLTLSDEIVQLGDRYYVKATATLTDYQSYEEISGSPFHIAIPRTFSSTAFAREALDKKGMDEAQITGAASSYARKYALCGLFCIDDGKDADADDNTAPATAPKSSGYDKPVAKPTAPKAVADRTAALKKRVKELIDNMTLVELSTKADYEKYVFENTDYELNDANLGAIVDALEVKAIEHGK